MDFSVRSDHQWTQVCGLLDSGSEVSLIRRHVYDRLPVKPLLKKSHSHHGPDGQPLQTYGEAVFTLRVVDDFGTTRIQTLPCAVADLLEDAILGYN